MNFKRFSSKIFNQKLIFDNLLMAGLEALQNPVFDTQILIYCET